MSWWDVPISGTPSSAQVVVRKASLTCGLSFAFLHLEDAFTLVFFEECGTLHHDARFVVLRLGYPCPSSPHRSSAYQLCPQPIAQGSRCTPTGAFYLNVDAFSSLAGYRECDIESSSRSLGPDCVFGSQRDQRELRQRRDQRCLCRKFREKQCQGWV